MLDFVFFLDRTTFWLFIDFVFVTSVIFMTRERYFSNNDHIMVVRDRDVAIKC